MKNLLTFIGLILSGQFRKAYELLSHMGLASKLAFLLIGAGSYIVHQYPQELMFRLNRTYYIGVIATAKAVPSLQLSSTARKNLDELIETLEGDEIVEMKRSELGLEQGYNTWQVAQMVVALGEKLPVEPAKVQKFFERYLDPSCGCWRETPQKHPHTAATAWTLMAHSQLGYPAPGPSLDFLLARQAPDGWWPLHPAKMDPKSASTYATGWATLALCSQRPQLEKSSDERLPKVKFAIENALNWLSKSKMAEEVRWHDYPASRPALKSVSISGLVVHTMHRCGDKTAAAKLAPAWLSELQHGITDASMLEASNVDLYLADGALEFDRTRHYPLQWQLIATVDAYPAGSTAERANALQWVERILRPALASPEVRNQNWVAAELLYALRYLKHSMAPVQVSEAKP